MLTSLRPAHVWAAVGKWTDLLEAGARDSHDAGLLQQLHAVEEVRRLARLLCRLQGGSTQPSRLPM